METTGIILAGGKSSRMGTNKALLEINGKTVIEKICDELDSIVNNIIIVTNSFEEYQFLGRKMVEDTWREMGPLAGIHAGLSASETERNLIVACDMPFISAELGTILLGQLSVYDAVVPNISSQLHPLFAAYRKDVKKEVEKALEKNKLRIRGIFQNLHVKMLDETELRKLNYDLDEADIFNMNHPNEYEQAKAIKSKGRD
ncbi:molybdenum cofactor guanylyltransferase [Robertmurraya sp. Marseille-Q9965]